MKRRRKDRCEEFPSPPSFGILSPHMGWHNALMTLPHKMKGRISMLKTLVLTVSVMCCWAAVAFGQATDTPFQVHDATNLDLGDTQITITNSDASSTVAFPNQN